MALPLSNVVRLLRALGPPLAPAIDAETSYSVGRPTRLQLPAASEDFELALYPSARPEFSTRYRRQPPSTDLRILDVPRPPAATAPLYDGTDEHRSGRYALGSSLSRPVSPAPSLCSTKSDSAWSDASRPPLGRRRRGTRRVTAPEAEAL
jgi:hypothetical protein